MEPGRQGVLPLHRTREEAQGSPELLCLPPSSRWARFWAGALDLVFPPRCALCGQVDHVLCPACTADLNTNITPIPLAHHPPVKDALSTGWHTGNLRRVVKTLKYASDYSTAARLAAALAYRLAVVIDASGWTFDMIVPLPLHNARTRERGYNQSQLVALALAQWTGIECSGSAASRWRATRPQVGLNRVERRRNVENAFQADPSLLAGRLVLIVDDVCTTGATLAACATAISAAGASAVYCITVSAARGASA